MITDGQDYSPTLLYVPLSDKVIEVGKQGLSRVTYDGETLWDYGGAVETTEYKIPKWIRDNASGGQKVKSLTMTTSTDYNIL